MRKILVSVVAVSILVGGCSLMRPVEFEQRTDEMLSDVQASTMNLTNAYREQTKDYIEYQADVAFKKAADRFEASMSSIMDETEYNTPFVTQQRIIDTTAKYYLDRDDIRNELIFDAANAEENALEGENAAKGVDLVRRKLQKRSEMDANAVEALIQAHALEMVLDAVKGAEAANRPAQLPDE